MELLKRPQTFDKSPQRGPKTTNLAKNSEVKKSAQLSGLSVIIILDPASWPARFEKENPGLPGPIWLNTSRNKKKPGLRRVPITAPPTTTTTSTTSFTTASHMASRPSTLIEDLYYEETPTVMKRPMVQIIRNCHLLLHRWPLFYAFCR